jgi:hexosaminidase
MRLTARVGQVPFNYQIGDDIKKIVLRAPHGPMGELEVRAGCDGKLLASLSLAAAAKRYEVSELPSVSLPVQANAQDLCFQFTQAKLDPLWALDSIELSELRSE